MDFNVNTMNILRKETDLSFSKSENQRPDLVACLKNTVCSKYLRFNCNTQMVVYYLHLRKPVIYFGSCLKPRFEVIPV